MFPLRCKVDARDCRLRLAQQSALSTKPNCKQRKPETSSRELADSIPL